MEGVNLEFKEEIDFGSENIDQVQVKHEDRPPHLYEENVALQATNYTCQKCGKIFSKKHNFVKHIKLNIRTVGKQRRRENNKKISFICNICGKSYCSKEYLQHHIVVQHEGIKPYQCPYCEKVMYSEIR